MPLIVSPFVTVWSNSTSDSALFAATGWLPASAWVHVQWRYAFNSPSGAQIRIRPAYQFAKNPTDFLTAVAFSNGSYISPSIDWNYVNEYLTIAGAGTANVGPLVRFGFFTKLNTGSTLEYARLQLAIDGRD